MESPQKKRRVQESQVPNASSTPKKDSENKLTEVPSMSGISRVSLSSCNSSPQARRVLKLDTRHSEGMSFLDLLENSFSTLTDLTIEDNDDEEVLDYDEFFKTCGKIQRKGGTWKLYKPIGDQGTLYHQIVTDPKGATELAKWFIQFCNDKPSSMGTYILFRFYFDCAGYQRFSLKESFKFPPDFDELLSKLNTDDYTNQLLATKKFLFADNARLAKILKFGIYNFLQKFVLEAVEDDILYGAVFTAFLKLVTCMCRNAVYTPLVYTAYIFVMKILTAVCMVKEDSDIRKHRQQNILLDNYINFLYISFTNVCQSGHKEFSSLKIVGLKELNIWINYSAKVFVDHFNCTEVLKHLLIDESTAVRLAALDFCLKLIQNEKVVGYLKAGPIDVLGGLIWGRVSEVNMPVQLKAMEVYTAMITNCLGVHKRDIFEKLVDCVYHEDSRMGSAAGRCVIAILTQEGNDDITLLLSISKISKKFHSNLKSLLVESCIDHSNVLQNWPLIIEIFWNSTERDVPVEVKMSLSELLLESVHVTLTGRFSRVRGPSTPEKSVCPTNNGLIASEIYPYLKRIIALYRKEDVIMQSFFKILVKISPEYLTKDQCEVADQLIQHFIKFFIMWENSETLNALTDYLLYVNQNLPTASSSSKNAIDDLKKHVSEELYKSFKSKNNQTLLMAKKTTVVFSKLDLNQHIEWSKLLTAWALIDSNAEFIENVLASCHWSLMWRIRKLSAPPQHDRHSKPDVTKEISHISIMSTQFFGICYEIMKLKDKNIKFKAFERICETCISFCLGLENISKQIRALDVLIPIIKDDALRTEIMDIFELSAEPSTPSDANRFRKFTVYVYHMASLGVLPMDCLSVIFKYFDKYYDNYGPLMEKILLEIRAKNENWIPQLLVNTLSLLHEDILVKHGVVDVRSKEAKGILSLSRRLHAFKKIMNPKIAGKLLVFAVNYASVTKLYDFLIYVRPFTDEVKYFPLDCKEILKTVREKIPQSARKDDAVLYFVEHLHKPVGGALIASSEKVTKKARGRRAMAPRLKVDGPKVKGKRLFKKTPSQTPTGSDVSDQMSIHDSSSDDLEMEESITPN